MNKETYHLYSIKLHNVCVTPDSARLVGVGTFLEYKPGSKHDGYEREKQLIGAHTVHTGSHG